MPYSGSQLKRKMKNNFFKSVVLILSILFVVAMITGCGQSGNSASDDLSLEQQTKLIRKWAAKINIGDTRSEVNEVLKDNPALAEQLDDETLRELYVAQTSDLEDVKKRWDETVIATIKKDIPSLQVGFTNDIVSTIITRTSDNKKVIVQETRHSQDFDDKLDKERKNEDIDKDTGLYKKFKKISKELNGLWSKDETISVEDFEKKYGEASFKTEKSDRTNMIYLDDSRKPESIDELNEILKNEARDFLVVIGNNINGAFVIDFKHLKSAMKNESGDQTQITSSDVIINRDQDLADREEALRIRKQHTTK